MVSKDRIVVIAKPDTAPIRRIISELEKENKVINLTRGRKTRAVVFTDAGYVILSPLRTRTIAERFLGEKVEEG
jgi:hypothetical protein